MTAADVGSFSSPGVSRTKMYTSTAVTSTVTPTVPRLMRHPTNAIDAASGPAAVSPPRFATDVHAPVSVPNSLLRNHRVMICAAPT